MPKSRKAGVDRRQFLKRVGAAAGLVAVGPCEESAGSQRPTEGQEAEGLALVVDPDDTIASSPPAQGAADLLRRTCESRGLPARICRKIEEVRPKERCILVAGSGTSAAPESFVLAPTRRGDRTLVLASAPDALGLAYALTELADRVDCSRDPRQALQVAEEGRGSADLSHPQHHAALRQRRGGQRLVPRPVLLALVPRHARHPAVQPVQPRLRYRLRLRAAAPGHLLLLSLSLPPRRARLRRARGGSQRCGARPQPGDAPLRGRGGREAWPALPARPLDPRLRVDGQPERQLHDLGSHPREPGRVLPRRGACAARSVSGNPRPDHPHPRRERRPGRRRGSLRASGRPSSAAWPGPAGPSRSTCTPRASTSGSSTSPWPPGLPVRVSPKFWAEHMGLPYLQSSIRALELPTEEPTADRLMALSTGTRNHMRYSYGDLLMKGRRYGILHRVWPGTQRLLLWGDPAYAAQMGRTFSAFGADGVEFMEPLSFKGRKGSGLPGGRDAYRDASLRAPGGDWRKYEYTYRLWGRLAYDPSADPEIWRRPLRQQFGAAAEAVESGLAQASRILPLDQQRPLPVGRQQQLLARDLQQHVARRRRQPRLVLRHADPQGLRPREQPRPPALRERRRARGVAPGC